MPGIFDKLRTSLGLAPPTTSSKGHVLGSGDGRQVGVPTPRGASAKQSQPERQPQLYEVAFPEGKLGMVLRRQEDGSPVVDEVVPGSSASNLGVQVGDVIVGVEGNIVNSYEAFLEVIGSIERPANVRFQRGYYGEEGSLSRQTSSSSSSSSTTMREKLSSMVSGKAPEPPPLSEEEKANRRAAMVRAAQDRGSAWEKRVAQGASKRNGTGSGKDDGRRIYDHDVSARNPETARGAAAAKQAEEEAVRRMGYNPFKPHMSFSGAGPTVGTESTPRSGSGGQSSRTESVQRQQAQQQPDYTQEVEEKDVDAVNEALGMLLSAAEADPSLVESAIATAAKMLKALADNRDEAKFRSIRLANEAFQKKVAACPGGIELFLAAGFTVETEAAESTGETEAFLKHNTSPPTWSQLCYTLQRIADMQ